MSKAENLVIMFTDIVGFTELTSAQSRDQNEAMLRQNEKLLNSVAKQFGGKRIKSIGDALLLIFRSPTDAVHCAMAMHDSLWEYNQTVSEEERLTIRVSLNSGEVRLQSGDVFGEPVNVAARLEGITPPNEVYFTEAIYLSMNKAEVLHEFVGSKKLKGIPEEISIYRVPRGAAAQRLVAIDSEDSNDEAAKNQYPFGGMHRREKKSKTPGFVSGLPFKKMAIAAAVIIAVVAGAFLFQPLFSQIGATQEEEVVFSELNEMLENDKLTELEAKVQEALIKNPEDPVALFMQGHLNFEKRSYKDGLQSYLTALSFQADLASDERYAENLIKGLASNGTTITELVKLSPTEEVVEQLSQRSIETGISGRRDAAYILRLIDRQDKMDSVAMAILDLQESTTCEDRKAAIAIMKARKDPRAIPELEAITKAGVAGLFKNSCVRKDAREALDAIHGNTST